MSDVNVVKSIIKAFNVIEELEKHGPMSIGELSVKLSMDKSTIHRIVNTIKETGYITQDTESRKYSNGIRLFRLGQGVIERIGLNTVARPFIESLAEETEETINLAMRMENKLICVDKIESKSAIKAAVSIGAVIPMYCTGVGKALLAFLQDEEKQKILKETDYERFTKNTITNIDLIEKELIETKANGFSSDREEYVHGLICFGAPIFDHRGMAVAAVSVQQPSLRFEARYNDEYSKLVKTTAMKISRQMGYISIEY